MSKVLSIGECMIEFYRNDENWQQSVGGDSFNTLTALARLKNDSFYLSSFGEDIFYKSIQRFAADNHINLSLCSVNPQKQNSVYFIYTSPEGEREFQYYRRDGAGSEISPAADSKNISSHFDLVYSTGITQALSKKNSSLVESIFMQASQNNKLVAYDLNFRPKLLTADKAKENLLAVLPYIDFLFASEGVESEILYSLGVEKIFSEFKLSAFILKKASKGSQLLTRESSEPICQTAFHSLPVTDTTGAGDVFNAAFLHSFALSGKSAETSLQRASRAAELQVSRHGSVDAIASESEFAKIFS